MHLLPLMTLERDRTYLQRLYRELATEADAMRDVPDWVVGQSVYHTKDYVPRRLWTTLGTK
jgi:NADH dehydrogenase (ubiquinone) 1 alpha subcomplex subunit 13